MLYDCPDEIINKMCVTDHASQRMRQRLGIRKSGHKRQAIRAFKNGTIEKEHSTQESMHLLYHDFIYIFSFNYDDNYPVLLTVFHSKNIG